MTPKRSKVTGRFVKSRRTMRRNPNPTGRTRRTYRSLSVNWPYMTTEVWQEDDGWHGRVFGHKSPTVGGGIYVYEDRLKADSKPRISSEVRYYAKQHGAWGTKGGYKL